MSSDVTAIESPFKSCWLSSSESDSSSSLPTSSIQLANEFCERRERVRKMCGDRSRDGRF